MQRFAFGNHVHCFACYSDFKRSIIMCSRSGGQEENSVSVRLSARKHEINFCKAIPDFDFCLANPTLVALRHNEFAGGAQVFERFVSAV